MGEEEEEREERAEEEKREEREERRRMERDEIKGYKTLIYKARLGLYVKPISKKKIN